MLGSALTLTVTEVSAQDEWRTISSLIGSSKYEAAGFPHYDYVNPQAPKGGTLNLVASGGFDSFNPFVVRGNPGDGLSATGGLLFDTLMQQASDEGGTSHPLIAEAFKYPADYSSATYRLNPKARWHDGQPITVDDVIWSFNTLKANSPFYNRYFANVTEAVAAGEREVEFRFDQKGNRELPHILGDLAVLPRHWWEGTDAAGRKRDVGAPTLEPPLGSGPYRIESFKAGDSIVWSRVPDYWAADLPVNVGRFNFDRRRYVYIEDDTAAWQAFTKGGYQDLRIENRSRRWATEYTFPAMAAGDVIKAEFKLTSGSPMQGFVMNQRRAQFQDRNVRQALTLAMDFETMNQKTFFGLYARTDSYFEGGELASSGVPTGKELEILEPLKDKLPPELFTQEFRLPVYDSPQAERRYLGDAVKLFAQAGWKISGGRMLNAEGKQFTIEILGNNATDEVISNPYIANLKKIGIAASLRIVDPSQYVNRLNGFDFDMVTANFSQSQSPGNEQRDFWSSTAAKTPGSRNLMGISDPVVDQLTERVIFATDRDDLLAATHALDRVLLWNYYVVPQWHNPKRWVAYWNKFGLPAEQPSYIGFDLESWWIDTAKEAALTAKTGSAN
ncbi:MAG: extracellular solute-binding protein [Rhizobiaceae bacterium]